MKVDIDTMLKDWSAPSPWRGSDSSWEERADAIVNAALVHKEEAEWGDEGADALFASPNLPPEPGEPTTFGAGDVKPAEVRGVPTSSEPAMLRVAGDSKMSDKQPERSVAPPSSQAASGPRSKRGSLREMAERHSTRTPMATPLPGSISAPSISTPLPSSPLSTPMPPPLSARAPLSTPLPRPSTSTPIPSRPIEAGRDDSGVVNLDQIRSNVTREQEEAAAAAQPASQGLFEDDDKPAAARAAASAPASTAAPPSTRAAAAPAKKKSSGAAAGLVIAVLGLAAAFAITQRGRIMQYVSPPPPIEEARVEQPAEPQAAATEAPVDQPAPAAAPAEAAGDPAAAAPAPVAVGGPLPRPGPAAAAAPAPPGPAAAGKPAATTDPKAAAAPATPGKPGDLASEMAKAVGSDGKPIEAEKPEPASGGKASGSVPEQPPQGSVSAAVGSVMGAAKACVGGADDVSKATITFGSNGAVKSVAVSGWAASNGATGCVKSALQGANVGAFSKPSFTVGVTIRP